jgi:hypothetical protein
MSMTVKKLISELEKIENKYLEVEIMSPSYNPYPLERIVNSTNNKKVFLFSPNYSKNKE